MAKRKLSFDSGRESGRKLDSLKFGLAGGIVTGFCVSLITLIVSLFPGYAYTTILIFSEIYGFLGYSVGWLGAVLGLVYGFIDGFLISWIFALIYNKSI